MANIYYENEEECICIDCGSICNPNCFCEECSSCGTYTEDLHYDEHLDKIYCYDCYNENIEEER